MWFMGSSCCGYATAVIPLLLNPLAFVVCQLLFLPFVPTDCAHARQEPTLAAEDEARSNRSAAGQSHPFRYGRTVIVAVQYDGSLNGPSSRKEMRWGSEIDLLELPAVRKQLGWSDSESRDIERQLKEYSSVFLYLRDFKSDPNDTSWDDVKVKREKILELLGDRRADELGQMDRYLFFRREGPVEFLKAFCSKQVQIDDARKNELRARELEIWQDSLEKGTKAWKATLTKIGEKLPGDQQNEWKAFIEFWEQPLIADIAVQQFSKEFLEEVRGKKANAGLKDLIIGESELPDGEKAYQATIGFQSQFEMEVDGSWSIRRYSIDPGYALGYQFTYLFHQDKRTGKNDLDITSDQFEMLEEKSREYRREVDEQLTGRDDGQNPIAVKQLTNEEREAGKRELREKLRAQVWDEVLFPFQKDMLVEDAQNRLAKIGGPLTFFDRDSVKLLPNHSDLDKAARQELDTFRKQLEAIEKNTLSSLYDLVSKYDPGFQSKDRPDYLPPSLFNMYINKTRYSAETSTGQPRPSNLPQR